MNTHSGRLSVWLAALAFAAAGSITPAFGQTRDRTYDIIAPEPWLPPRHRSIVTPSKPPKSERIPKSVPLAIPQPQGPTIVPGLAPVPNLPPAAGLGARESFPDRAARCAHQSALFNVPADKSSVYMHGCALGN